MKRLNAVFLVILQLLGPNAWAAQQHNLGPTTATTLSVGTKSQAATGTILDVVSTTKAGRPCPPMTQTQRDAIASPATGSCIFNTSTSTLNQYTGSAWSAVSGGSGGSKNYLSPNHNAETNSTTGWSLAHSSLTSAFPSTVGTATNSFSSAGGAHGGSAASGNLTLGVSATAPLANTYSYTYTSSAATTAGDMLISDAFTIDTEDQSKPMSFKVFYTPSSNPTNGNWSGTSSNSFGMAIYDVTNGAWIMPTGVWNFVQSTGVGIAQGSFQATSNSTQYQIAMFNANATSGAITLKVDDWLVGPQSLNFGPAMSDWIAFTPTGSWISNTTYTGFYRRKGDSIDLQYQISLAGAPTAATLTVNLPSGVTLDSSKLTAQAANTVFGGVKGLSAGNGFTGFLQYNSTTSLIPTFIKDGATASNMTLGAVTQLAPYTFAASDFVTIVANDLPVAGWSSNSNQSNDTDTRVIGFVASSPTATVTGSASDVSWTSIKDDCGGFDGTKNYTVCVTGWYDVEATMRVDATYAAGNDSDLYILKNGSAYLQNLDRASGAQVSMQPRISSRRFFNAGDVLRIQVASAGTTPTVTSGTTWAEWSVIRRSGPAVISASETVAMRASLTTAQTAITDKVIPFNVATLDTHAGLNTSTGVYTIPAPGKYRSSCHAVITSSGTPNDDSIQIRKGGSNLVDFFCSAFTATAGASSCTAYDTFSAVSGDTIDCFVNGDASFNIDSSGTRTTFTVERIGN